MTEQEKRSGSLPSVRSEELSEILGTPPGWLVRWGTGVVVVGFLLLMVVAWLIEYPDVITARVEFTTATPPVDVVARAEGHIQQFLVEENEVVQGNQPLLVLENAGDFKDIRYLEQKMSEWGRAETPDSLLALGALEGNPELGELRGAYLTFVQQMEAYQYSKGKRVAVSEEQNRKVQQQINELKNSNRLDQELLLRTASDLKAVRAALAVLSRAPEAKQELAAAQERVQMAERLYIGYQQQIARRQAEITDLQRSIGVVRFDESLDTNSAPGRLKSALSDLKTALERWKQKYLLTAPISGRVSLSKFYVARQYVREGEHVLTVVPPADSRIIGRSMVPTLGSGKILPQQRVVIRLDNYPAYEFGTLSGTVLGKSAVPKDNAYLVTIGLDSIGGTTTSFNKSIAFQQQLQGEADIITAEKRFLERIVDQLFAGAR